MDLTTIAPLIVRWILRWLDARRGLGLAVLTVALLGTAGCSDRSIDDRSSDGTHAPARSVTPTTTIPLTVTTPPSTPLSTPPSTAPSPPSIEHLDLPTDPPSRPARPTATVDRLVGAVGARVHLRCVGQGPATVVLIAGFEGDLSSWSAIESGLATRTRVCSYDRPGTGTSDPADGTSTFGSQAGELHALLRSIGEPGPYVVVGHSFGGAQAITFAAQFASDVIGVVLVDASPSTWPAELCAVPDDGSAGAATILSTCATTFLPTGNREHLDVRAAFAEVAKIRTLGSLPMGVITATARELPTDLPVAERARLTEAWDRGQDAWAALSTASHVVEVDQTGHHIEIDQPAVVIDEIVRSLP